MIKRKENYRQVCVWPGTIIDDKNEEEIKSFVSFFNEKFNVRVQFLESIVTKPDLENPDTGGRHDILFAIHNEDVMRFAIPRFNIGVRWIEDVLDNERLEGEDNFENYSIYPDHLKEYRTW